MATGSPPPSALDGGLDRLYANRFTAADRRAKERAWRVIGSDFLQRYIAPDAAVLDLGAGYCEFLNAIRAGRKVAVDLNPDTKAAAGPGVEVLAIPFDRLGGALPPASLDVVFASNVFEHLRSPDALIELLGVARALLRPGGSLLIMQPNIRCVGAAFWDYVDHTLPLTEKGMAEALRLAGFEVVECRARFLPYTFKSRLPAWPGLVRLYLRLRPAHWLFGKQMFLVARRAEGR
jgi:SAM-dependent methyltransferase